MMKYQTMALQNEHEFKWFVALARAEGVRSYLEIGGKWGGSMWMMGRALGQRSLLVSVDLAPYDTKPSLDACLARLSELGYITMLIEGDSTDERVIERVRALAPFDLVFIDANHTLPYVTKDWETYGPMAKKLVAFHDINWKGPRPGKTPIDVPEFWDKLKQGRRHSEIKLEARDNGIGVLWV